MRMISFTAQADQVLRRERRQPVLLEGPKKELFRNALATLARLVVSRTLSSITSVSLFSTLGHLQYYLCMCSVVPKLNATTSG